jgi:hypothetical protein
MKDNKRNGSPPKHKRLLAAVAAEKTIERLAPLSDGDLWLLADEIFKQDQTLCRRMAYALGRRVSERCDPPRCGS